MPPKPNAKKGEGDDFSDLASLPQANMFQFTIIHKTYFDNENREVVKKAIAEKLLPSACDRMRTLTRDEIVTYGKGKAIIADTNTELSAVDQVARSAADRLFEMTVNFRRTKRDKLAAAAEKGEEAVSQIDHDLVDGFIYLVDYPSTYEEMMAFSRYSQSVQAVFEIDEIPRVPESPENSDAEDLDTSRV
jgi:hypothetical protein